MFDEEELRGALQSSFSSVVISTQPRSEVTPDGTTIEVADVVAIATR